MLAEAKPIALLMLLVRHDSVVILPDHVIHIFLFAALRPPAWHPTSAKLPEYHLHEVCIWQTQHAAAT